MQKYRIRDYGEETTCDHCGCPLFAGDTAYAVNDGMDVYCSRTCAEQAAFDAGYGPMSPGVAHWSSEEGR